MIVVIDNYDSFTYNLVQYLKETTQKLSMNSEVRVFRNDEISVHDLRKLNPEKIVISPGPGHPAQAGLSNDAIKIFAKDVPILGVCLGHQCLAEIFGAKTVRASKPTHGKTATIHHDGRTVFKGLSNPCAATRYHSLIVDPGTVRDPIDISARTTTGEIMGIRIRGTLAEGVQFHPESILTTEGKIMIKNFLTGCS